MFPVENRILAVAIVNLLDVDDLRGAVRMLEEEIERRNPVTEDMLFILEAYGVTMLPKVEKITAPRRATMRKRWKEHPDRKWWVAYFARVRRSPFLMGQKPGVNWKATFDWLMNPTNLQKVTEGNYDPEGTKKSLDANDEAAYRMSGVS